MTILSQYPLPRAVVQGALVCGLNKSDDFERNGRLEWRLSRLEHFNDLLEQFAVDECRTDRDRQHAFVAECECTIVGLAGADAANGSHAAVLPMPGRHLSIFFID